MTKQSINIAATANEQTSNGFQLVTKRINAYFTELQLISATNITALT